MTTEFTQADNDAIVEAVKKATGTSARLSMTASNERFARGLQIYRGPYQHHRVETEIRDIKVLTEIVKAFDAAWRMGHDAGVRTNQAQMRDALGLSVNDTDDTVYIPS